MGAIEEVPADVEGSKAKCEVPSPSEKKQKRVRFVETESESEEFGEGEEFEAGDDDQEDGMPGGDQFIEVIGSLFQTEEGVTIPEQLQAMSELLAQHVSYMRRVTKAIEAYVGAVKPAKKG